MTKTSNLTLTISKSCCFILVFITLFACTKVIRSVDPVSSTTVNNSYENGIFVVNEGNFNWGNASITFINKGDSVEQDVFRTHNDRSLGDVAESMQTFNDKGFIIVNNSNDIDVVSLKDFKLITSITGFSSPRFMTFVDSTKAYVTNMQNNISVIDMATLSVAKSIPTLGWTESIIKYNTFLYVSAIGGEYDSSYQRKARVLIIDTKSDQIVDSIKTGKEPIGLVMDKKNKIWVLCTGGYDHFEPPSLLRIDPILRIVEKTFSFPDPNNIPSRLCINAHGDTLYFLDNGVYQMPVSSLTIPSSPLIPANGHLYYGLGIQPSNGNIFVSDAIDYTQSGVVYQYDQIHGSLLKSFPAGRIPGSFCFISVSKK